LHLITTILYVVVIPRFFLLLFLGIDSGFLLVWHIGHNIGVTQCRRVFAHWWFSKVFFCFGLRCR